jgi:transposase
VDEKSEIQALQRAQPILPMDFGQPERRTHNYVRHGTLDLFAALNVATDEMIARCTPQHRAQDFVAFLREIESTGEPTLDIHVVLDNLSAHRAPPVQRWLLRHPRVHFHFTPTYASWLNLVERFLGLLTEKALKRGSHTSIAQLRAAIRACRHPDRPAVVPRRNVLFAADTNRVCFQPLSRANAVTRAMGARATMTRLPPKPSKCGIVPSHMS